MAVKPVSIAIFVEDPLEHGLESFLEELLYEHGLKLLADGGRLLLFGYVLRMGHLHEHGGIHAHVLFSYAVGFHLEVS